MSEYVKMELDISCKEDIIAALEKMKKMANGNFDYQVHDTAVHLQGYEGSQRPQVAEIIVPNKYVGGSANDLGFKYNEETKKWDMIISEFDRRGNLIGTFKQLCNLSMMERVAKKKMMKVELVSQPLTALKQKQKIKIRVR